MDSQAITLWLLSRGESVYSAHSAVVRLIMQYLETTVAMFVADFRKCVAPDDAILEIFDDALVEMCLAQAD